MKRRHWIRRVGALLFAAALLLALSPGALADGAYDFSYAGVDEWGERVGSRQTGVLKLSGGTEGEKSAYCIDTDTYIVEGGRYARSNLEDATYFSDEQARQVRAIVLNAYPFVSLETLSGKCGIGSLTKKQAITAAQLAIWRAANGSERVSQTPNVAALYEWFLALPPMDAPGTGVGAVTLAAGVTPEEGGTYAAWIRYGTNAVNADGTPVQLSPQFSAEIGDICTEAKSSVQSDGTVEMQLSGISPDTRFTCAVEGVQSLPGDAYFYAPEGGRASTQSLVGAYGGTTRLYAAQEIAYTAPDEYSLTVFKKDSKTGDGIEGAVFELADNEAFSAPTVYEKTTDKDGYATFEGLHEGSWYLREKTAPVGYVPDEAVYPLDIDAEPHGVIEFKNTHYGQIQILKTDDADETAAAAVEGAHFAVYRGGGIDPDKLLYADLITDENGIILVGKLTPGDYFIVETAPPVGYHMAEPNTAAVTIEPHDTVSVRMVNPKVQRGRIGLAKEDYTSHARLNGAVVGLFSDAACTEECKLAEFTTNESEVCWVEDLLPGVYYAKEVSAPEGYVLNVENSVVTVELEEGEEETVVFRNRKRIDTAGNYGLLLLIGLGAVLVTGTLLVVFRKRLFRKGA